MTEVIRASGLVKRYGQVTALDGFDLVVPEGTVLALLGPNGAGKTTAVRIFTTLLEADSGSAEVAGLDVRTNSQGVRERIGLSGQYAAVDEYLTGFENLDMIGRLYRLGRRRSRERARELLELFDLSESGDRPVKTYSGGMRRRLDLAGALVAQPAVLFLDEPTTGLDPRGRMEMWDVIRELVGGGTTLLLTTQYLEEADRLAVNIVVIVRCRVIAVGDAKELKSKVGGGTTLLLTTQYLEEADRLADNIVVIDRGRVIAEGDANELKTKVGGERVELIVDDAEDLPRARSVLVEMAVGEVQVDEHSHKITAPVSGGAGVLMEALRRLDAGGVAVLDVGLRRPTLDDVFLTLTGHAAEIEPEDASSPADRRQRSAEGSTDASRDEEPVR